jgi:orotidine-5'-phosphate decarboxylase
MANRFEEQISTAKADALSKSAYTAEKIMKESTKTMTESGNGSAAAVQELTKAYQELAARGYIEDLARSICPKAKSKSTRP